jgi:hypothetical protein
MPGATITAHLAPAAGLAATPRHRQNHQRDDGDASQRPHFHATMCVGISRCRVDSDVAQRLACARAIGEESDQHAHARGAEAEMPADFLAEIAGNQRRHEGADVDAHVENREAGVSARAAFRVKIADDRGDVGLQLRAEHDGINPMKKAACARIDSRLRYRSDQDSAVPDRAAQPNQRRLSAAEEAR